MRSMVVTTAAMLVYLDTKPSRSATLGELASHFRLHSWREALGLLWSAALVEFAGHEMPFELSLPPRPGTEEPDEAPTTSASVVTFGGGDAQLLPLSLTLSEVIAVVAMIDALLEVTPTQNSVDALMELRAKLVEGSDTAGYGDAMWEAPHHSQAAVVSQKLIEAIENKAWVTLAYHAPGCEPRDRHVIPILIESGEHPCCKVWIPEDSGTGDQPGSARTFRLDRITDVRMGKPARRAEYKTAKTAVISDGPWIVTGEQVTMTVRPEGRWIVHWLHDATSRSVDRGIAVTFTVRSDTHRAAILGQVGEDLVSLEPASIAQRMHSYFTSLQETIS